MDTSELELLKKVLPDGYEVVNEGIEDNGHSLLAVWNGDDWQHAIANYTTAKQVIDKILEVERDWARQSGRIGVTSTIKELLGIREDINAAVKAHRITTKHG